MSDAVSANPVKAHFIVVCSPSLYACVLLLKGQLTVIIDRAVLERSVRLHTIRLAAGATVPDCAARCHRQILYCVCCAPPRHQMSQESGNFFLCNSLATLTHFHLWLHPFSLIFPPILLIPYIDLKPPSNSLLSRANFPLQPEVLSAAVCFVHRNSLRL